MPTAFMAVADSATSFDWTKMRGPNAEYSWYGFDTTASHSTYGAGGSAYTQWASYVAKLTDGSVAEDFLLRAEDTSKDILIAYEIEESDLTGFSMSGISCTDINVYVSDSYATLFSSVLTTVTPNDSSASAEFSTSRTTFIGFRLNGCNCRMKEISVFGHEPVVFTDPNVVSGLNPTAFMAVADGATSFDWTKMRGPSGEYGWYGFDTTASHSTYGAGGSAYTQWASYVAKLTDGSVAEDFLLRAEDTSKDILIAYAIEESDLTGFTMDEISCTSIDVYASNNYATLFSSLLTTVTPSSGLASASLSTLKTTFIGFRLNGCNCRIKEISVYGTASPVNNDPNLLPGRIPTAFMAVADGATSFDWTKMRGPNAEYSWYGFDRTASHGTYGGNGSAYRDWATYVAKLTDSSSENSFLLRAEDTSKDILITYEVPISDISKFTMDGISCTSIDFYASDDYSALFNHRVATAIPSGGSVEAELAASDVQFIGFRLNGCNCSIKEISVFGKTKDLVAGKLPVALFPVNNDLATYSFAYMYVGDESHTYRYGLGKPESAPSGCDAEVAKMTDSDQFTKTFFKNPSKDDSGSHDLALAYKLDDFAKVSKISVVAAANMTGSEIYLSKSFTSLFNSKNRVFKDDGGAASVTYKPTFAQDTLYVGVIVRIPGNYNNVNLKSINVIGRFSDTADDSGITTKLGAKTPVNSSANSMTKAFYQYLQNVGASDGVLLGAHINSLVNRRDQLSDEDNYYSYLERELGRTPSIYSTTIGNGGTGALSVSDYKQYYDQGAVPMISCLFASKLTVFHDLVEAGDDASINYMVKYLDKTYTPTSSESTVANAGKAAFWDSVEDLADFLEDLEDAGVETYILSPFNEMNMYGFYGNKNHTEIIDRFINVWRQVYDYLVNERELTGVLFALRPTGSHAAGTYRANPYRYYPGDNYVDIVAPTVYSGTSDGTLDTFDGYSSFVATGKVIGLSETGPLADYNVSATADCLNMLNSLKTTYSAAAFASLWYGHNFNILRHENYAAFINDDYIITTDKMLDYRHTSPVGVKLYAANDFAGNIEAATCGSYTTSQNSVTIHSVAIDRGYKITFYSNANYTGNTLVFGRDISDISDLSFVPASYKIEYTGEYNVYDSNSDDEINILDLIKSKKFIAGVSGIGGNALAADIDNSGNVNATDLSLVTFYLLEN